MAELTEDSYGTIKNIEGKISSDKKDNGNYVGGKSGKGTFVGTRYGVTFDWWYNNIKGKSGKPSKENEASLIKEFNSSVKNADDARGHFQDVYFDNPRGNNLSLTGIEDEATAHFILDSMINQQFKFSNDGNLNIYQAIRSAGGENTGDIINDLNSIDQQTFRKEFLKVRANRYSRSGTFDKHGKGWMKRLDDLQKSWSEKGSPTIENEDFSFTNLLEGQSEGDYKLDLSAPQYEETFKGMEPGAIQPQSDEYKNAKEDILKNKENSIYWDVRDKFLSSTELDKVGPIEDTKVVNHFGNATEEALNENGFTKAAGQNPEIVKDIIENGEDSKHWDSRAKYFTEEGLADVAIPGLRRAMPGRIEQVEQTTDSWKEESAANIAKGVFDEKEIEEKTVGWDDALNMVKEFVLPGPQTKGILDLAKAVFQDPKEWDTLPLKERESMILRTMMNNPEYAEKYKTVIDRILKERSADLDLKLSPETLEKVKKDDLDKVVVDDQISKFDGLKDNPDIIDIESEKVARQLWEDREKDKIITLDKKGLESEQDLDIIRKDEEMPIVEEGGLDKKELRKEQVRNIGNKALGFLKENWQPLVHAAMGLTAGALGHKSMSKALEDIPVEEGHQLDASWRAHMAKMKQMSESGLTAEEKASAHADLSKAYNLGVKNVMRAAGGSRAAFLANAGVLNANRVEGLLKVTAMDAAMQRQNLKQYGAALQYQQTHDQREGEIDRKMAYDEAKRKSDLHGQLGSSLISVALDNINKAMVFNSTKGDAEALANLYKTKEDTADVQNELNEVKNQNTNLGINQ